MTKLKKILCEYRIEKNIPVYIIYRTSTKCCLKKISESNL